MKKHIPFLLTMASILLAIGVQAQTFPTTSWADEADASWYVASETEFTLSTAEELAGLTELVEGGNNFSDKTIMLGGDIDLDGHLWTPIGTVDFPFSGMMDGNEHAISNVWINSPLVDYMGLFGNCMGASFANITVNTAIIRGGENVGALVANLSTESSMENCHSVNVDIQAQKCNVGGLVGGLINNSSITRSSAQGFVSGSCQVGGLVGALYQNTDITESYSEGTIEGNYLIGGLVGTSILDFFGTGTNTITDCYSRAEVTAFDQRAGGFMGGGNSFEIQNSYSTGTATAEEFVGGFVGSVGSGSGENNYFDMETSGTTEGVGGFEGPLGDLGITAKPTDEMKTQDMVDLLNAVDAEGPWILDLEVNDGYPILSTGPLSTSNTLSAEQTVSLYPTIFDNSFTVESDVNMERYEIYNMSGALLEAGELNTERGEITPRQLTVGMYIVRIHTQHGMLSKKVIKE